MEDSFAPTEKIFTDLIASEDHIGLIRDWRDVIFHTLFAKRRQDLELPVLLPIEDARCFIGSPDPVAARAAIEDFGFDEELDVFIKPVPLGELARNAFLLGAWFCWTGSNVIMNTSLMHLIGMKAIKQQPSGQELLYQAKLHELQNPGKFVEIIKAQSWVVSTVSGNSVTEVVQEALVIDDRGLVVFGPGLGPSGVAKNRSELSADEQALFDWWALPLYDYAAWEEKGEGENRADENVKSIDTYVPAPSIIGEENLLSFYDLERAVHNQIMPDATRLQLEVIEDQVMPEIEEQGSDELLRVDGRRYGILFVDHPEWSLPLGGNGLAMTDYGEQVWLPKEAGIHEVPEHFRSRLTRAIAWVLFWQGRDPGKPAHLVLGQFGGVKPFCPDNMNRLFVPDATDGRFPALACMPCGTQQVPVLVHGEVPEGYVCEVLEECRVPASDLPRGLVGRDSLLVNGSVPFVSMCTFLMVPVAAIEFPEEWYTGIRTSNTQLISDFEYYLAELGRSDRAKQDVQGGKDPGGIAGVFWACAGFMAFIILLMVLYGT
ncbi:MAG: hypothetical protein GYB26_13745 [Gammaproteobacteria bacterium]|nr:hypothetical protein [Gammaproteobacteria bacterium]